MNSTEIKLYQRQFIEFALEQGVLKFGEFTLKSGRTSPYFFNAGLFNDGEALSQLGKFYAQAIIDSGIEYDVILGPAYKGIPLVSAASIALANEHGLNKPYVFNRKEKKDHGEGGLWVGAPLKGKVLIIDDVITAGTAIGEVMDLLAPVDGVEVAGVIVAMDRQEKGKGELSAIQEVEQKYNIPVASVISLNQLLSFLEQDPAFAEDFERATQYRREFGV